MQDWEDLVVKEEVVEMEDQEEEVVKEERILCQEVVQMDPPHVTMVMVTQGRMEYQDSLVVLVHLGMTMNQVSMACLLLMVESCGL